MYTRALGSRLGLLDVGQPMIEIEVDGETVVGKRHPYPAEGQICVHILAPFGQCGVDGALGEAGQQVAEQELLRRLYQVCRWAEDHAPQLHEFNEQLERELAQDSSMLSPRALSQRLTGTETSPEQLDVLCAMHQRYEDRLLAEARGHAEALACPSPDVAASCWELLALNDFYRDGRNPLLTGNAS